MDARHQLMVLVHGAGDAMTVYSICKLGIPDILHRAGANVFLSVEEIAKQLPSENVNTPFLARVLDGCVAFGVLAGERDGTMRADGRASRRYGLNEMSSLLVTEENPGSMAPLVRFGMHPLTQTPWHYLSDAVLTGAYPFTLAHGKNMWEVSREDAGYNTAVNESMVALSSVTIDSIVGNYEGFQDVKTLVDVAGGTGRLVREVVKKHPHIHGIVFDLPHVVAEAPRVEGVEYVGGDMFKSVPSGDAIFMKHILHDWDDEKCIQILRNCMRALPEHGKVILSESVVPELEDNDRYAVFTASFDLTMLTQLEGGMERTKGQWTTLLRDAGFARIQFVQLGSKKGLDQWLIECYPTNNLIRGSRLMISD